MIKSDKKRGNDLKKLDNYCTKILTFFLLEKQEAHYNELYRLVKEKIKLGKFSKPTFNTHLKHLMEAGFVKRTPDKGQLVTYSLNLEKIGRMKEYSERVKRIVKSQSENMNLFFSRSEKKQVETVLSFLSYRKLYEIESRIEYALEPDSFEKWFVINFWRSPLLEQLTNWMVKRCAEDDIYREKILISIEKYQEELENAIS